MFFPNVVKKNSALSIVPNIGERGISYWFMLDLKKREINTVLETSEKIENPNFR